MVYALDTNIVIHYLRGNADVRKSLSDAVSRGDGVVVPGVVNYEMMRGFKINSAPKKEAAYRMLTDPNGYCRIKELDSGSWQRAELIYAELYRKHLTVGELDILIAAFCLDNDYTLVTNNTAHFQNINGLRLEDWVK
jgi:predicted nucleic acid-binding protein